MEFLRILKYVDGLSYHSQPDYAYIRQLFTLAVKNYEIKVEQPFDWQLESSESSGSRPASRQSNLSEPAASTSHAALASDVATSSASANSPAVTAPCYEQLADVVHKLNGTLNIDGGDEK